MPDLTIDSSILEAAARDFLPLQEKGDSALTPCLDLWFGTGSLNLAYAEMPDRVLVTPERILIAIPWVVNMERFRKGMAVGGALRNALVDLRCAAIIDGGILTACGAVNAELQDLSSVK